MTAEDRRPRKASLENAGISRGMIYQSPT